jgi:hypothetical protein
MHVLRWAALVAAANAMIACGDDDRRGAPDAAMDRPDAASPTDSGAPADGSRPDTSTPSLCPPGICDLLRNGCGPGQGCYFLSPVGDPVPPPIPLCQPTGTGTNDSPCANYTDCAPGLYCERDPTDTTGRCKHYCCGGSDASCPDGEVCAVTIVGPDGSDTGVGACARLGCSLLDQDCPGADGCYLQPDGSLICADSEAGIAEGGGCSLSNDCSPGLLCVDPTATGTLACRRVCDATAAGPVEAGCQATQSCTALGVASQPNAGVCMN